MAKSTKETSPLKAMRVRKSITKRRPFMRTYPTEKQTEEEKEEKKIIDKGEAKGISLMKSNAKLTGYRKLARAAGFTTGTDANPTMSSGVDVFKEILLVRDVKKLIKFFPQNLDNMSYSAAELEDRYAVSTESFPGSALREAQARTTNLMRLIINESVLRAMESGKNRVDAATVNAVVRNFARNMRFTAATPPPGVLEKFCAEGFRRAPDHLLEQIDGSEKVTKKILSKLQSIEDEKLEKKAANEEKRRMAKATKAD